MKIELICEKKIGQDPWYEVRVDGQFVTGSYTLETAENKYNQLLVNPNALKSQKIVLKFAEIDVTSQS